MSKEIPVEKSASCEDAALKEKTAPVLKALFREAIFRKALFQEAIFREALVREALFSEWLFEEASCKEAAWFVEAAPVIVDL